MRGLVWLILAAGMMFAASPVRAQRYDPNYPVCMEVYGGDGSRIECFFTSMEQCKMGTSGTPGQCFNNPGYVAPAPEPVAAVAEPAPVKPAKPKSTKSAKNAKSQPQSAKQPAPTQ